MRKYWWIAALVFAADRASKLLAVLLPPEGVILLPGVVMLRRTENTGIAFSMFGGRPWLLGIISLVLIIIAFLVLRKKKFGCLPHTALMLMLGGAVGNMIDRFVFGYVTDMIELLFVRFAVFNVADSCLVVGCAMLIISLLFRTDKDWGSVSRER